MSEIFSMTLIAYPDRATILPKMNYSKISFYNNSAQDVIFYIGNSKPEDQPRDGRGFILKYKDMWGNTWHPTVPDTSYYAVASNRKEGAALSCIVYE